MLSMDELCFFFFNDTATTEIYTLSLHDALPISERCDHQGPGARDARGIPLDRAHRSEEHTSELQSRQYLVCRLLLEKKKHCRVSFQRVGIPPHLSPLDARTLRD